MNDPAPKTRMSVVKIRSKAVAVLRDRGIRKFWNRGPHGLIWLEGEDVRTLVVSYYNNTHNVIRLAIDFEVLRYPERELDDMAALAVPSRRRLGQSELTILSDEAAAMLPWALSYNAAIGSSSGNVPHIAGNADVPPESYWPTHWTKGWSARAAETDSRLAPRHAQARRARQLREKRQEEKTLRRARQVG